MRNWEFDSSAYYFYITLNILEMVTISMVKKKNKILIRILNKCLLWPYRKLFKVTAHINTCKCTILIKSEEDLTKREYIVVLN